ncbi:MAG: Ig-like domain-containing protein [Bacteroidota bacterium]
MKNESLILSLFFINTICANAQTAAQTKFYKDLQTKRVASSNEIVWEQVGPGNAGFANLLRYHPTIPGRVATCPDMWNAYQSDNNGETWYGITDSDGRVDFYHLRDLYYSVSDPGFALAIGSSRLFQSADTGRSWQKLLRCPWYKQDANGEDRDGWRKKVSALAIDPSDASTWYVGGGSFVRGQEWLSCYKTISEAQPHGLKNNYAGKVWRTKDAGKSWKLINTGLHPEAQIGRLVVNPTNPKQLFAASNYGLYRSDDSGSSWKDIGTGKLDNNIIMDMDYYYDAVQEDLVLYVIDQVQYVADGTTTRCTGGIFQSVDYGETWENINGNLYLDYNRITGGASDNYYQYIGVWFGITPEKAKATYPDLPTRALQFYNMISADPSRPGAVYVGMPDPQTQNSIVPGRLWTTENNGKTWVSTARLYEEDWKRDKDYWEERGNPWNGNMEVGHSSPHMKSGKNYALRSMRALDVGVDGSVMIISDHSTMLSKDHGQTWQQVDEDYTPEGNIVGRGNSNLPGLTIAQDKRNPNMILGSGEHKVWIPTDDSPNERQALKFIEDVPQTVISLAFDPYDGRIVYATSSRQKKKQYIFRSGDAGYSWEQWGVATPATNKWKDDFYTNSLSVDPINNHYLYHGITRIENKGKSTQGGFFVSDDQGKTFKQSNNGLPSPARISDIEFDPRDNDRASLFAAAEYYNFSHQPPKAQGGLYHSKDRGASWLKVNTPPEIKGVNYIALDHSNRMYITTGYRGKGNGAWYTDDFGETWEQVFKVPGAVCVDISPFDRNFIVITVEFLEKNPGVYVSRDRGLTWAKSNTGLVTPNKIEDIKFNIHHPGEIWAANKGTGFYKGIIAKGEKIQVVDVIEDHMDFQTLDATGQLQTRITNETYKEEKVSWKSENTNVVKVDKKGVLQPIGKGMTKIWATTKDERFSDYCVVVVHTQ